MKIYYVNMDLGSEFDMADVDLSTLVTKASNVYNIIFSRNIHAT